ncbi:hypothetical protein Pme01_50070 [Planosporangium mesophilum]|uniref:Uncharacterized protein n=1 Tax=Planosporangium mesophilum TaxID=689768 RepID=A0A8J3TQA3_9ACTN|nr:hypothetical protein [Planosporangium mesophilum]GII25410.1 hypothetical protein Pme01_50070 [Planosporangium mesophilum]
MVTPIPESQWIQAGDVVRIPQAHYCYGLGPLIMCVTVVGADIRRFPALEWVRLCGLELRPDGSDGGWRDVLVRVAALFGQSPPHNPPRRRPNCLEQSEQWP